jgi:hypothetical protein
MKICFSEFFRRWKGGFAAAGMIRREIMPQKNIFIEIAAFS